MGLGRAWGAFQGLQGGLQRVLGRFSSGLRLLTALQHGPFWPGNILVGSVWDMLAGLRSSVSE